MTDNNTHDEVVHDETGSQFLLKRDGAQIGKLTYRVSGDSLVIDHTSVDPELQGQGLASLLTRSALDELASATRKRIIPMCPYVVNYVRKHPEYMPLTQR